VAVQDTAFVVLHVSVEALPLNTPAGLALSVTVGAGGEVDEVIVTVAVAAAGVVPLAPSQVSV
jgi:hypothetical protein